MVEIIPHNLLIIDARDNGARAALKLAAASGVRGEVASTWAQAKDRLSGERWDMVLADLDSLGDDACTLIEEIKSDRPEMPLVMTSPAPDAKTVLRAVRAGCDEFLIEPITPADLQAALKALLPAHNVPLAARFDASVGADSIVGTSPLLLQTLSVARKVAGTSLPVLVTGESGTGKELISSLIHFSSRRRRGPFVKVNCAALSDTLLESELFGHERGAFTGAHQRRRGLFEQAHGGTLLLDEISETPARFQAKLLRVIEEQDFQRVGGSERVRVDVRVVSTSNRRLETQVAKGRFRGDLLYRIGGLNLVVPPLRKRIEDIESLVWHFINRYSGQVGRTIEKLEDNMMQTLHGYEWPGNVRQLCSVVRTALAMGSGAVLKLDGAEHLCMGRPEQAKSDDALTVRLRDVEREAIAEALRRTKSHYTKAADMLGITDRTLRDKIRRYRQDGQFVSSGENRWLTQAT